MRWAPPTAALWTGSASDTHVPDARAQLVLILGKVLGTLGGGHRPRKWFTPDPGPSALFPVHHKHAASDVRSRLCDLGTK